METFSIVLLVLAGILLAAVIGLLITGLVWDIKLHSRLKKVASLVASERTNIPPYALIHARHGFMDKIHFVAFAVIKVAGGIGFVIANIINHVWYLEIVYYCNYLKKYQMMHNIPDDDYDLIIEKYKQNLLRRYKDDSKIQAQINRLHYNLCNKE